MRPIALALAAALVAATAAPALAGSAVGVSVGIGQVDRYNPARFDAYQSTSSFQFRTDVFSPYSEMMFGLVNRAQTLDRTRTSVFDTSGLSISAGGHYGFFRAGLGLEAAWLRQIVQDPTTPGTLRFHNGGGFVVEPYVGVALPFLHSEVTELEISLHYPIQPLTFNDSIGPRLLLTLWLGGDAGDDELEEEESTEMEAPEEEVEEEIELPKPAPTPTAAPAKPAPKPLKPAKPASKPAKKK